MANPTNTAGVNNLSDPQRRVIAVPASNGTAVLIAANIFSGYVEIQECPPGSEESATKYDGTSGTFAPQGMNYQRADENYVNTYGLAPGAILLFGDSFNKNRSIGVPARTDADGSSRPATPFVKLLSATGTATQIEIREWRQR